MSLMKARELAVLSVLNAHPVHGYQVAAAFEKGPLQLLGLKRAAVYGILARFVERGWTVEKAEKGSSYPDRRVNYITDLGRAGLRDLASQGGGLSSSPLMALMLLHDSGVDVTQIARSQLSIRRQFLEELLEADSDHMDTASHQLAIAITKAEGEVLEQLLKT